MKEEWKDIHGFEGQYQVSSLGRVKSCNRIVSHGSQDWSHKEKILKPFNSNGYHHVKLSKDNKAVNAKVHRLVAKAFLKEIPGKNIVNHLDENRTNNEASNLEWCNNRENLRHSTNVSPGKFKHRKNGIGTKLDEFKILAIFSVKNKFSHGELASLYEVSRATICRTINGKGFTSIYRAITN